MTGQELKQWRKRRRCTQERLCLLLGIGHSTLRYWEAGKHRIPSYLALALAYIDEKGNGPGTGTGTGRRNAGEGRV